MFVHPNFALGHLIQWTIDPTFAESEPYKYTVEVSGTKDFSVIEYTIDGGNDTFFVTDKTNFRQTQILNTFYRVKLETNDNNTYYSRIVLFGTDIETRRNYRLASEIVRKETLRHKKFTGIGGYLLKRKQFGQVRIDSVDPISGVPIADNTTDYGTGLDGGYYGVVPILFTYENSNNEQTLNPAGLGVSDVNDYALRMVGHPIVEVKDVIIDRYADYRMIVKKVEPIVFPGTGIVLVQKIEASEIPATDNIYKIEIENA